MPGDYNTACPAFTWRPAEDETHYGYRIIVSQYLNDYHITQIWRLYPRNAKMAWRSLIHNSMENAWSLAEWTLFRYNGAETYWISYHNKDRKPIAEYAVNADGSTTQLALAEEEDETENSDETMDDAESDPWTAEELHKRMLQLQEDILLAQSLNMEVDLIRQELSEASERYVKQEKKEFDQRILDWREGVA